jgi:Mn2+/Fe2+ NRAMP family transporter
VRGHRRLAALALVAGPGLLAGLSDDDPPGITTYSVLGARFGYELLWVLVLATGALIVFHELGARLGIVTGQGLTGLVRERYGVRWGAVALAALVAANLGTTCAEFAGVAAALDPLGIPHTVSVPITAIGLSVLVLRGSFHRVEHVLLALSALLATYILAGLLAHPDWGATARGLAIPSMPGTRAALFAVVATVGTTLAPWGLAFIQSYAADKHLMPRDLGAERIDVITGALLTGVIGVFVVIACAATLHPRGIDIVDARDAAKALEPLAGHLASALFTVGLLGAALVAASILPLSTAYSICDALGAEDALDDPVREAPLFYGTYAVVVALAAALVVLPGAPLVSILVGSQALNAVLLVPLLIFMRALGRDAEVMGRWRLRRPGSLMTLAAIALISACVLALGWFTLSG